MFINIIIANGIKKYLNFNIDWNDMEDSSSMSAASSDE